MAADIAKINARWKKGCLLAFVAALWLFHITTAVWFVAHCEPTEAEVLKREERLLPGKRKGWANLQVSYVRADGKPDITTVRWRVTTAPAGTKIPVWRARSGLIKVGPASWAETFYVETMMGYLALFIGVLLGGYLGFSKLKARIRKRLARKT
ncbi:MAG: hypothetical protein RL444_459 [Verrucomicrobiota bacterium]|jgi:hypothetical protein